MGEHPSLMDQARLRSATSVLSKDSRHRRLPSNPKSGRHSRKNSESSITNILKSGRHSRKNSESSIGSSSLGSARYIRKDSVSSMGSILSGQINSRALDAGLLSGTDVERIYTSVV